MRVQSWLCTWQYHYCQIKYSFLKLIFKCINARDPEIVSCMILKYQTCGVTTRGAASGDCRPAKDPLWSELIHSKKAQIWNAIPTELKALTTRHQLHLNNYSYWLYNYIKDFFNFLLLISSTFFCQNTFMLC